MKAKLTPSRQGQPRKPSRLMLIHLRLAICNGCPHYCAADSTDHVLDRLWHNWGREKIPSPRIIVIGYLEKWYQVKMSDIAWQWKHYFARKHRFCYSCTPVCRGDACLVCFADRAAAVRPAVHINVED